MIRIYRRSTDPTREECFYLDVPRMPKGASRAILEFLLNEPFTSLSRASRFEESEVEEIGPRVAMETSFSSTAVGILAPLRVKVSRLERSLRFMRAAFPQKELHAEHLDLMTQEIYPRPLRSFDSGLAPVKPRQIPLSHGGVEALLRESKEAGFAIDPSDAAYYLEIFDRDPFDAELGLLGNANSDHSRHRTIGAPITLDDVRQALTIMQMVKAPYLRDARNSVLAFKDGAGVIRGGHVEMLVPERPGYPSRFVRTSVYMHITHTAETHNHPCYREPFEGAATGVGGMLRDKWSQGRGALVVGVNGAGYCTGNPVIPGHSIPGAHLTSEKSIYYASALDALIEMSNGACDYANKIGEPIIFGFCRAFEQYVSGVRRAWTKPICYVAGVSRVDDRHVFKRTAEPGMLIISMGNPARRVGVSGGAASSMEAGTNVAALDFASVQRGEPEEENRGNRALRACAELGDHNPIIDLSDQGAGGPGNLFLELVGKLGGRIDIHKISCADPSMSALERLIAEFQERYGLLIRKEDLPVLQAICTREDVVLDVIGEITGDGRFVVDSNDGTIVDLSIAAVLADLPVKELHWKHVPKKLEPLQIPADLSLEQAFVNVMSQVSVGSKGFLTRKGDRSVGGLVAQQQCCGPMQIPICDVAVMADSYYARTGSASALGEQPIVGLIDVRAGARKAVAEMVTNICAARIIGIPTIKCRLNEMWAAKQAGEGALLYEGVQAAMDAMERLDFFPDGGKDSLSMAAKDDRGEMHVAPGQIVVFGTAPVGDVRLVLTPDFKFGGCIGYVDIGSGKRRLGGSAFAQSLGQLGNEAPDADIQLLNRAMKAQQQLLANGLMFAYHDVSDGGLGVAVAEMCMAANCGAHIRVGHDVFGDLFSEEVGFVFEYRPENGKTIDEIMRAAGVPWQEIGMARPERRFTIRSNGQLLLDVTTEWLRRTWEATSDALEMLQAHPDTVREEQASYGDGPVPFRSPSFPMPALSRRVTKKPRVAIIRARGSNGDREMTAVCEMADLEPVDVTMKDIFNKSVASLKQFEGAVFVGGFANADTFGSAKGWAASIIFNKRVKRMFEDFYHRRDTFSLGVCNGCQLMALLGWLPDADLPQSSQPRLLHNLSRRFESRWTGVRTEKSPTFFFRGMEGSILGINVAHGEGRFYFPDASVLARVRDERLIPLVYVGPDGEATERYPHNPNGSPFGIAALCSPDGRHVGMMPHSERCFLIQQMHYVPPELRESGSTYSPWIRMFRNVHDR